MRSDKLFLAIALTATMAIAHGANIIWSGAAEDGDWFNAANWVAGTDAIVPSEGEFNPDGYRVLFETHNYADGDKGKVIFSKSVTHTGTGTGYNIFDFRNTLARPVIFSATDDAYGLTITQGRMAIGSASTKPGKLIFEKGTYSFPDAPFLVGTSAEGQVEINGATVSMLDRLNMGTDTTASPIGNGILTLNSGKLTVNTYNSSNPSVAIGFSKGNNATLNVKGGELNTTGAFRIASAENSVGVFNISGGDVTINNGDLTICANSGATGELNMSGGTLTMNYDLKVGYSGDVTGSAVFSGGKANIHGINLAGNNGIATMTVKEDADVKVTTSVVSIGHGTGGTGTLVLEGGVFSAPGLKQNSGTGKIQFNGGTLKANGASSEFITANLPCEILTGGATIDTDYSVTVKATSFSGVGGLTKKGSGTLTFETMPTYSGDTRIESGKIVFPSGSLASKVVVPAGTVYRYDPNVTYANGIELEEDGYLAIEASAPAPVGVAVTGTGDVSSRILVVAGEGKSGSAVAGETSVEITVNDSASAETVWAGNGIGEWNDAANWTCGIPSSDKTVKFLSNATVKFPSTDTGTAKDNTIHEVSKLVLDGCTVAFVQDDAAKFGQLKVGSIEASAASTIALDQFGIGSTTAGLTIPQNVTLEVRSLGWLRDCDNANSAAGLITVNGKVDVNAGAQLQMFYDVNLLGGATGEGTICVGSDSENNNYRSVNNGNSRTLGGDWRGFCGSYYAVSPVYANSEEGTRFTSDFTGSATAIWNFRAGIYIGTHLNNRTIEFGTFNLYSANIRRITTDPSVQGIVFKVGAGEIMWRMYQGYTSNSTTQEFDVTFEKVGDGKFTYSGYGFQKFIVDEGELALGHQTQVPSTMSQWAGQIYAGIKSLTVKPGAVVSGVNGEKITIDTLAIEDGGYIAASASLTDVATASIEGAKVLATTAPATGGRYVLLSATSLSGKPYGFAVDADGNDLKAGNGKNNEFWRVKATSTTLRIFEGNPNAGTVIILR